LFVLLGEQEFPRAIDSSSDPAAQVIYFSEA